MKEINRYRLALLQYRLSLPFKQGSTIRMLFKTNLGFCHHFYVNDTGGNKVFENTFKKELPILYIFKPQIVNEKFEIIDGQHRFEIEYNSISNYWFDMGNLNSRINLLKSAIKYIKENK
jgi:hypothetical protein